MEGDKIGMAWYTMYAWCIRIVYYSYTQILMAYIELGYFCVGDPVGFYMYILVYLYFIQIWHRQYLSKFNKLLYDCMT